MPPKNEPGRDPEMVGRTQKLNLVFALSSLALLLTFSWMVWADYDREWKKYQADFNTLEVSRTQEQIKQAASKVDANRRAEIQAQLAKGEQEAAARAQDIAAAQQEIERLHAIWYRTDQDFRFTKAEIDAARFRAEEAA